MGQPSGKLATRGLSVLSTLTDVAMGPYPMHLGISEGRRTGRVKVEIPYFCTAFFDRRIWVDHTDDASAPPPTTQSAGFETHGQSSLQMNLMPETNTTPAQETNATPWTETWVDFESAAEFSAPFPDLSMQLPIPSDSHLADSWGLGL